jgi:hypothetical protein
MFGRDLCVISIIRAQYSRNSWMSILTGIQTRYIGYSRADRLPDAPGRAPSPTMFGRASISSAKLEMIKMAWRGDRSGAGLEVAEAAQRLLSNAR